MVRLVVGGEGGDYFEVMTLKVNLRSRSYLGTVVGGRRGGRKWAGRGGDSDFSCSGGESTYCSRGGKGTVKLQKEP